MKVVIRGQRRRTTDAVLGQESCQVNSGLNTGILTI